MPPFGGARPEPPEGDRGQNRPPSLPFPGKKSHWEHQFDNRRHLLFKTAATHRDVEVHDRGPLTNAFGSGQGVSSLVPATVSRFLICEIGRFGRSVAPGESSHGSGGSLRDIGFLRNVRPLEGSLWLVSRPGAQPQTIPQSASLEPSRGEPQKGPFTAVFVHPPCADATARRRPTRARRRMGGVGSSGLVVRGTSVAVLSSVPGAA